MRRAPAVDLRMFGEAFPLLIRNPSLFLAPLFAGILGIVVQELASLGGGDFGGGIVGSIWLLVIFIIDSFGLAISIIIARECWRRGRGTFDEGWEDARHKAGDLFLAALGLNFIVFVALQAGSFINPYLGQALFVIAFFFLIYTIPAAAIGGVPGGAALNTSIERVRSNYPMAIVLAVCFVVLYWLVGTLLVPIYTISLGLLSLFIGALVRAIVIGYFALVLARGYEEVS